MPSWRSRARLLAIAGSAISGVAYPFAVYFYRDRFPALAFVAAALLLIAVRLMALNSPLARLWRIPLLLSALLMIAVAVLDRGLAKQAYPVVQCFAVSAIFAWTLISPPSLIERFARLRHAEMTSEATRYCRNVTVLWAGWLAINGAVAAVLAFGDDLRYWTIWTGIASYMISGLIFMAELGFRLLVLKRHERA
jgi:uncharacterized membrane protein